MSDNDRRERNETEMSSVMIIIKKKPAIKKEKEAGSEGGRKDGRKEKKNKMETGSRSSLLFLCHK